MEVNPQSPENTVTDGKINLTCWLVLELEFFPTCDEEFCGQKSKIVNDP